MDLAKWTTLEAQELYFFNFPKAPPAAPEFQQLYEKKTAAIWKEIDRLEAAKRQKVDMRKEKVDTQNQLVNGHDQQVEVMIADLEEQFEDLDRWFDMEDGIMKAKGFI